MKKQMTWQPYTAVGMLILAISCAVWWGNRTIIPQNHTEVGVRTQSALPVVKVTLDKGEVIATYSGIIAQTPYAALTDVAQREDLELTTKQYDFGVLVEKIGSLKNGTDRAWIVSVNGKSLTVAADKAQLTSGDSVVWAYKQPIY